MCDIHRVDRQGRINESWDPLLGIGWGQPGVRILPMCIMEAKTRGLYCASHPDTILSDEYMNSQRSKKNLLTSCRL